MKLNTTPSNPYMSDNRDVMELVKVILDELQRIEDGDIQGGAGRTIIRQEVTEDDQQFELGMMDRFIQAGKDLDVHLSNGRWISPDEYNIDQNNVLTFVNQKSVCKKGDVIFFTPNLGRLIQESDSEYMKHLRSLWDYLHTSEVDVTTIRAKRTTFPNREITGMINVDSISGNHLHNILGTTWKSTTDWVTDCTIEYDNEQDEFIIPHLPYGTKNILSIKLNKYVKPSTHYIALMEVDPLYNVPYLKLTANQVMNTPYLVEVDGKEQGIQTCIQTFETGVNVKGVYLSLWTDLFDVEDSAMIKFKNLRVYEITQDLYDKIGTVEELTGQSLIDLFPNTTQPITPVINPSIINIGKEGDIKKAVYINNPIKFKGVDLPSVDIKMMGHTTQNLVGNIDKPLQFSKTTSHFVNFNADCVLGQHRSKDYSISFTIPSMSIPGTLKQPAKMYLIFDDDFKTGTYIGTLPHKLGRHAIKFTLDSNLKTKKLTGIMIEESCIKAGLNVRITDVVIINNDWRDKDIAVLIPPTESGRLISVEPIIKLNGYYLKLADKELRSVPSGRSDTLRVKGTDSIRTQRIGEFIITKDNMDILGEYTTNTHIPLKLNIPDICRSTRFKEDIACANLPIIDVNMTQLSLVDRNTPTYIGVTPNGDVILNINVHEKLRNASLPSILSYLENNTIKIYYKLNNPIEHHMEIDAVNISKENQLDRFGVSYILPYGLVIKYNSKNPNLHSITFNATMYNGDSIYPTSLGTYRFVSNWRELSAGETKVQQYSDSPTVTTISIEVPSHIESTNDVIACGVNGEALMNLSVSKAYDKTYVLFDVMGQWSEDCNIEDLMTYKQFKILIRRELPVVTNVTVEGSLAMTDDSNTLINTSESEVLANYQVSIPANVKGAIDTFVKHNIRNAYMVNNVDIVPNKRVVENSQQNVVKVTNSPNYMVNGGLQIWLNNDQRYIKNLYNETPLASLFKWYSNGSNTSYLTASMINNKLRFLIGEIDTVPLTYANVNGIVRYELPEDVLQLLKGRTLTLSMYVNSSINNAVMKCNVHQLVGGVSNSTSIEFDLIGERRSLTFTLEEQASTCTFDWYVDMPVGVTSHNFIELGEIKLEIGEIDTPYYPISLIQEKDVVNRYVEYGNCELMGDLYTKEIVVKGQVYNATDYIQFETPKLIDNPKVSLRYHYGERNVTHILSDSRGFRICVEDPKRPIKIKDYTVSL